MISQIIWLLLKHFMVYKTAVFFAGILLLLTFSLTCCVYVDLPDMMLVSLCDWCEVYLYTAFKLQIMVAEKITENVKCGTTW